MTDNIFEFPAAPTPLSPLVGPFSYHAVCVDGRRLPFMTGAKDGEDRTVLIVDERFTITVPNELAYQVAWLLGHAMAVASGYSHVGATSRDAPFAPEMSRPEPPR